MLYTLCFYSRLECCTHSAFTMNWSVVDTVLLQYTGVLYTQCVYSKLECCTHSAFTVNWSVVQTVHLP